MQPAKSTHHSILTKRQFHTFTVKPTLTITTVTTRTLTTRDFRLSK